MNLVFGCKQVSLLKPLNSLYYYHMVKRENMNDLKKYKEKPEQSPGFHT